MKFLKMSFDYILDLEQIISMKIINVEDLQKTFKDMKKNKK